ncbi:hypothetical protein TOPH_06427 [Tolypocladium ophioglossoides CBS 100239]|uniref:Uncharacterized protein n=1 Tax=Tolypocladium ophioglossoides (strain CBS 100239) TaxID=1163406 RepID=A0A0L0N488_TOLOC|nr:hypothetical protein TOPH_06427 [Tolypocladium ophioglossoides CBS 100239]
MLCAMMLTGVGLLGDGEGSKAEAAAMSAASLAARASMASLGGTEAVITRGQPCAVRACLMPCQYCRGGRAAERESSEKPRRPWARTMGYLGRIP